MTQKDVFKKAVFIVNFEQIYSKSAPIFMNFEKNFVFISLAAPSLTKNDLPTLFPVFYLKVPISCSTH